MTESIGFMLLAIIVVFVLARLMKDAKAFTRLMAILAVSVIVGAGVKTAVASSNTSEKATVVSTKVTPTRDSISPFVLENTDACLDPVSKEIVTRDSVETEVEGLPTERLEVDIIDDS